MQKYKIEFITSKDSWMGSTGFKVLLITYLDNLNRLIEYDVLKEMLLFLYEKSLTRRYYL